MSTSPQFVHLIALLFAASSARAETPKPVSLVGHTGWIAALAFSPDSKRLVSGSADRTARVWDVDRGQSVEVVKGHADTVSAVAFAAEGAIVTGTYDGTVRLHSPTKKAVTLERRRGAVLAVAVSGDAIAAGGMDGVIALLDRDGKEGGRLFGHKTWVSSLAFRGERLASGSSDGTARMWEVKSKKLVKSFALSDPREIRGIALSPDGKTLAAACRYGAVVIWDVESGKTRATLDAHDGDAWSVSFAPDGKTLVSGGGDWGKPGKVRLWDTATWKERRSLDHPNEVLCVTVSPNGRWLAVGGMGKSVRVWDLRVKK